MADEPISALTQILPPPFTTAFTNPSTGAQLEILDTTNQTMASTGTNSRIFPGDLIMGYLAAGSNVTLTETSGIVTIAAATGLPGGATNGQVLTEVSGAPAWANPVTSNVVRSLASGANITQTGSPVALSTAFTIVLPSAGTYLISGLARCQLVGSSTVAGNELYAVIELHDDTASAFIANSMSLVLVGTLQVASLSCNFQQSTPIGPVIYTVTVPTTVELYAYASATGSATFSSATLSSDTAGLSFMSAVRLS